MRRHKHPTKCASPLLGIGFAIAALLLGAMNLSSGTSSISTKPWVQTGGPEGGDVRALAIDPQNPATVYAGTLDGGVFKSTNGGESWSAINNGLTNSTVNALAIDQQNPMTVYAGISGGVFKSSNGGASWNAINNGLPYISVAALAIDPRDPKTLFAGAYGIGVFKSSNGGDSWNSINNGLTDSTVNALAIDPQNPTTVFAGTSDGSIFRSSSGGDNWSAVIAGDGNSSARALAIDPQNPTTVYAGILRYGTGRVGGVFKSSNGGDSWIQVNTQGPDTILALAIDPQDAKTVYAGTIAGGVIKSSNGGNSWSVVNDGLTNTWIYALAIDPLGSGTVYAGTFRGGIFKTSDSGANWSAVDAGLTSTVVQALAIDPQDPTTLYAGTQEGVFKSSNGGDSWRSINSSLGNWMGLVNGLSMAVDPQNPLTVYAGTSEGVFRSDNGGITWFPADAAPLSNLVYALVIDPQNTTTVYAGTALGAFKSNNGGAIWSAVKSGMGDTPIRALAMDPQNPATIYAGTWGGGVFKSSDGAASWSAVSTGLTSTDVRALAIDPQNPMTVYAGTSAGVFKSSDGGDSWSAFNVGLTNPTVHALAIDPLNPTTVYAGTSGGVFTSSNAGAGWSAQTLPVVYALVIDPHDPTTVYAGTRGGSVFVKAAVTQTMLPIAAGGAVSTSTLGPTDELIAGYATVTLNTGNAPYGTAVFTYTQNGVVVSEAAVPASPPTLAAQFFVDSRTGVSAGTGKGLVNISTGFAAVNQGSAAASLRLLLRDGKGAPLAQGTIRLARGAHIAKFLDQLAPDFVLPSGFINNGLGSLEITSDQPVSVLALRLTINQRGDLLMTSTPISDLTMAAPEGVVSFPQIADGGGYQTALILMNTSNAGETGVIRFYGKDGTALAVRMASGGARSTQFSYAIPAGGFLRLVTDGSPSDISAGWAQLTADSGTTTPAGTAIFSFMQRDVLVTESGVAAVTATTHARIYIDKSGGHDTGLAVANPGLANMRITATVYELDGVTSAGIGTVDLLPFGHDAKFVGQFIEGLPEGFTGILDLSSAAPFAALTLRSLCNARGDFLLTTFPIADADKTPLAPLIFPQIADGGGYQTQIILLSASSAAATIMVSYLDNDGSPIAVGRKPSGATARGPILP